MVDWLRIIPIYIVVHLKLQIFEQRFARIALYHCLEATVAEALNSC